MRKITIQLSFDWEDYEDVTDELMVEDAFSGGLELKNGVRFEIISTPAESLCTEAEIIECMTWGVLEGFKPHIIAPTIVSWEIIKKSNLALFPVFPEYDSYTTKQLVDLWSKTRIPTQLPITK